MLKKTKSKKIIKKAEELQKIAEYKY